MIYGLWLNDMEYRTLESWVKSGIICKYCKTACYIYLPNNAPIWMIMKYRRIYTFGLMTTCVKGREAEYRETGGYNADYLISYLAHGEADK